MPDLIVPIDIPTLAFSRGVVQMMLGGLLLYLGSSHADARDARWWALAFACNGVSLFVFPLQVPPEWELPRTVVNHLSLGASGVLFLVGFWKFGQQPVRLWVLVLLLAIPAASLLAWEWLWPNARLRILATASGQALFLAMLHQSLGKPLRVELAPIYRRLRYVVLAYLLVYVWSYASIAELLPTTGRIDLGYHRSIFSIASLLFMLSLAVGCLALQFALLAARSADLAMIDWLTGLPNRRGFFQAVERRGLLTDTHGAAAVIALDVDHFKQINDRHGHAAGDRVLAFIGGCLRTGVGRDDIVARMGGEEFLLVLPSARIADAADLADRIRIRCEQAKVADAAGSPVSFTVSAGVSELAPGQRLDRALREADRALYAAKESGRNQVVGAPLDTAQAAQRIRMT